MSDVPVTSGCRHDSVTKRLETRKAMTCLGSDGNSVFAASGCESVRGWGDVSDVGALGASCTAVGEAAVTQRRMSTPSRGTTRDVSLMIDTWSWWQEQVR